MTTTRFLRVLFAAGIAVLPTASACADGDIESIVQQCAGCHGESGEPTDRTTIPVIWGQQRTYLVKQLHDYRAGDRQNDTMSPIAEDIKQDQTRKIAAYFASKSWPEASKANSPLAPRPKGLEQCQACHAMSFDGRMSGPRLAGLSYEYLLAAMNGFADGQRTNNGDMPKIMRALSRREREAMARYISEVRVGANKVSVPSPQRTSDPSSSAPHVGAGVPE